MSDKRWGMLAVVIITICVIIMVCVKKKSLTPTALDVYRGKTTLEITYRDSVAVDSTVKAVIRLKENRGVVVNSLVVSKENGMIILRNTITC